MASSSSNSSPAAAFIPPPNFIPAKAATPIALDSLPPPPPPPRAYRGLSNLKRAVIDETFMMLAFCEWKEDMQRCYPTLEEENRRFEIFKSRVSSLLSVYPDLEENVCLNNLVDYTPEESESLGGALLPSMEYIKNHMAKYHY